MLKSSRTVHQLLLLVTALFASHIAHADQWITPTQEELHMTSQPEAPGTPAVYLFREETTDDSLHMWSFYVRLKVLTEEGKKYGDVQLQFMKGQEDAAYSITGVQGRTIQPDGTVIPFTGKPYEKMVEKSGGSKLMQKVFSLPAVQVGSILEYRYTMRWDDNWFRSPTWFIQDSTLFTRKAHYVWRPTDKELISNQNGHETITRNIAWVPILPAGPVVSSKRLPTGQQVFELTIDDVKPLPEESFMPPVRNFSYRVLFYYTAYRTVDEYWQAEGKYWSGSMDKFMSQGSAVRAFVAKNVSAGDSDETKLQKLYKAVMQIENTSYTRQRTSMEEIKAIHDADSVLTAGHGYNDQIARLYVALARAAGVKAYLMRVTNRDDNLFMRSYLSFSQLDDDIVIAMVDGKSVFLDPGTRYCPFGHLDWKHTLAGGLMQTEHGASVGATPAESYKFSTLDRIADIKLSAGGEAEGTVTLRMAGQFGIQWRTRALRGDQSSLEHALENYLEEMLPGDMEVHVDHINALTDYEDPLRVVYKVKGAIGHSTATRVLLPGDIFLTKEKPVFQNERRETAVYFEYPNVRADATRITYPSGMIAESIPANFKNVYPNVMVYDFNSKQTPTSFTVWRNLVTAVAFVIPKEYPQLREFYGKFEKQDSEPVILKNADAATASAAPGK